mgnify:CR=1 FL=1
MKKFISFSFFLYIGFIYIVFCITFWGPIFLLVRGKNKYKNAKKIKFLWSKWMSFLAVIAIFLKVGTLKQPLSFSLKETLILPISLYSWLEEQATKIRYSYAIYPSNFWNISNGRYCCAFNGSCHSSLH